MGTVIKLPGGARDARGDGTSGERGRSATVIILPVIRIERHTDDPSDREPARNQCRRRRRRATPS
jgi:hypothetical protein